MFLCFGLHFIPYSSRLFQTESKDLDSFTAEEWFVDLQQASGSCFWVVGGFDGVVDVEIFSTNHIYIYKLRLNKQSVLEISSMISL